MSALTWPGLPAIAQSWMSWSCWHLNWRQTPSGTAGPVIPTRPSLWAMLYPGHCAWVEVSDYGGTWAADEADDEQGRGLAIVDAVAGAGNWGIDGDDSSRAAWFWLNWDRTRLADAR